MTTILADTFQSALARLTGQEQKAAKITAFDLQSDPDRPGMSLHRIDASKDPNFWSVRVDRDIRIIVHKLGASLALVYVGHHDDAYRWAGRRRMEVHPTTGALQIVEVRERVVEIAAPRQGDLFVTAIGSDARAHLFAGLDRAALLTIGVPEDWIADVLAADEDQFFALTPHLPPEAAEALLEFAATGSLPRAPAPVADPLAHPDTQRRFRVMEGADELRAALDAPFERWAIFLHPSQRGLVERDWNGPVRVVGSAGTGKTVVALHRVRHLLGRDPKGRVLLTTFSAPLAEALSMKLDLLLADRPGWRERVTVASFETAARELVALATGRQAHVADGRLLRAMVTSAARDAGVTEFSTQFLVSEWEHVIDPWRIDSAEAYGSVPRMGRKNRLGARQRERLWQVFGAVRTALAERQLTTPAGLFDLAREAWEAAAARPFDHVVVDEAQDLGVAELRFLSAVVAERPDALFFAGDLGQRIFQQPFSWKGLGIDVRGRSTTLRVNYRTSHQIRQSADRLLPRSVRDVDGMEDERKGTVSVFEGPDPEVRIVGDVEEERRAAVVFLASLAAEGIGPEEIGVFVRSEQEMERALGVVATAGLEAKTGTGGGGARSGRVLVSTMHLAKGLEFRAVLVLACDEGVLPLASRVADVADEFELDEVVMTERHLLYVALTRARERAFVSGIEPASEFLEDLTSVGGGRWFD